MTVSNTRIKGTVKPIGDVILVRNMHFGDVTTESGVIVYDDDAEERGIHPRWAEVYAVGDSQQDVSVGEWVLIQHGFWGPGVDINGDIVRRADPNNILVVADSPPKDFYMPHSMGHRPND